jgi:predicted  nucleic acid-binding Zn-ribbon protein
MNKYLEQLISLQKLDIEIDSFEPKVNAIREELDYILNKQKEIEKNISNLTEEMTDIELKKRKNELHLEELFEKLKEISLKSAQIKTDKEIKALQLEEDIAKEQIEFANEEIERFESLKKQRESEIDGLKTKLEELKASTVKIEEKTNKELLELEKQKHEIYAKKQELLSQMTQNIIIFYEKIRRWAGNTTVVAIKKQACYGCYMRLNDHTYAEVIKGEEITTCPHCGRILYLERQEQFQEA